MRRARFAVVGSISIHLLAVLALLVFPRDRSQDPAEAPRIGLTEIVEPPSEIDLVELTDDGGGSRGASATDARSTETATTPARSTEKRSTSPRAIARRDTAMPARADQSIRSLLGDVALESHDISDAVDGQAGNAGGGGEGRGAGNGRGNGRGNGVGLGVGDTLGDAMRAQKLPPAPKASKARPPKLIYPVRDHDVDNEDELYVARVTIDTDGYVVGSTLLRGPNGPRAQPGQIFRFRYLPALDDDGRPIKATIEQPFLVQ